MVIFQLFEFGAKSEKFGPPPSQNCYVRNVHYFDFGANPYPFWMFSTICDIFSFDCSP